MCDHSRRSGQGLPGKVVRGRRRRRRRGRPRTGERRHEDQVHRTEGRRAGGRRHRRTRAGRGARRRPRELGHRGRRSRTRCAASPSTRRATSTSPTPRPRASRSSPATALRCAPGAAPATVPASSTSLSRVAVGPDGDIYATDATSVQRFSRDGTFKARWGGWGGAPASCATPPASRSPPTAPSTSWIAGTGACRPSPPTATFLRVVVRHGDGEDDGTTGTARHGLDLDDPRGIAVAADGTIFVAENEEEFVAHLAPGRHGPEDLARPGRRRRRGRARRLGPRDRRAPQHRPAAPPPTARRSARSARASLPRPFPASA